MTRLQAGFRTSDRDGRRLTGIPSLPAPQVVVPGPARRSAKNVVCMPMSIRYMGEDTKRYRIPSVQGLGNRERNVLPADVWVLGSQYNTTKLYRQPVAIANPTWRINNLTSKDIKRVEQLQKAKRTPPGK